MYKIISKRSIAENIHEMVIEAPDVARKAMAGQFVVVMVEERGERIPLTVADWNRDDGTITTVFMVVGTTSKKLSMLNEGDQLYAFIGPLGHASEIGDFGTVIMVAGGVGTAPVYPIAKSLKDGGNKVIMIQGARTKDLLFWQDKLAAVCDEHIITTDDGTFGRKGLVTEPLKEKLGADVGKEITRVYSIGPSIMMKFCAKTTEPFGVNTIVSLNSLMVDATGMCGVCRVDIGGKTKFTCVDGPEFDGHLVNWSLLMDRLKQYLDEEKISYDRYKAEVGE
jgi:ferredoxin--NADP+ reductase